MERIVDLDLAAAQIAVRLPDWEARGLLVGSVTWRDEAAPWPQPLETERARVADPDSIGIRFSSSSDDTEMEIVLYRGGWADLDVLEGPVTPDSEVVSECPQLRSAAEFGALLDSCVDRYF
ncbi:hypothetical protein OIE66_39605 [Nonomuraea sp. NBC_01738]|uniref:hypothetical protein n=1 Tax=Nonomuraea sp. NBC_01738 TaxID=2976003 RepID=UPI002E0FCAA2|nr:hypothetical protein OIE66_39605 [Nonomuraea sp. NBC_01738]